MPSAAESLGFAPAKVNLTLRVTGRRPDGYHLLDSLVVFADVGDRLSVTAGDGLSLTVTGPFGALLAAEADNLVLRAARLLAEAAGIEPKAALTLEKNLPIASGIGGGSADAAAALRLLSDFWGVMLEPPVLQAVALTLGADVPVCLARQAMRMAGIGDVLAPVPALPPLGLMLANPGLPCPTPAIFKARAAAESGFSPADAVPQHGYDAVLSFTQALGASGNDLEQAAIAVQPAIGSVLAALRAAPDVQLARMSGSGATCFGIFPTPMQAAKAAAAMRHDGWWVWGGGLYEPPLRAL